MKENKIIKFASNYLLATLLLVMAGRIIEANMEGGAWRLALLVFAFAVTYSLDYKSKLQRVGYFVLALLATLAVAFAMVGLSYVVDLGI